MVISGSHFSEGKVLQPLPLPRRSILKASGWLCGGLDNTASFFMCWRGMSPSPLGSIGLWCMMYARQGILMFIHDFQGQCLSETLFFPFKEQTLWDWDFSLKEQSPISRSDSARFFSSLSLFNLHLSSDITLCQLSFTWPPQGKRSHIVIILPASFPSMSSPLWMILLNILNVTFSYLKFSHKLLHFLYLWALMVFCIYCKRQQRLDQKVETGVASWLDSNQCYDERTACIPCLQPNRYFSFKAQSKIYFLNNTME